MGTKYYLLKCIVLILNVLGLVQSLSHCIKNSHRATRMVILRNALKIDTPDQATSNHLIFLDRDIEIVKYRSGC